MANFKKLHPAQGQAILGIILILSILLIIGIWTAIYLDARDKREAAVSAALTNMDNISRTYEREIFVVLRVFDQITKLVKFEFESRNGAIDLRRLIDQTVVKSNDVIVIAVVDRNGEIIADTLSVQQNKVNIKDRAHFKVHVSKDDGQLYIGAPVIGRVSRKESVNMSRRLNFADGSFAGVVVIAVPPSYLTAFYNEKDLGVNGVAGVLGDDGAYRALRVGPINKNNTVVNFTTTLAGALTASKSQRSLVVPEIDGVARFSSYHHLNDYPLAVGIGIPESEVLQGVNEKVVPIYLSGIIATFVILAFQIIAAFLAIRLRTRETMMAALNAQLVEDIAIRRQTEKTLAKSEERFRQLADLSSDWYWEQDENFCFTMMSRDTYGTNGEFLARYIGKTRWDMPIQLDEAGWSLHKATLTAHQPFSDFEYKAIFPNKEVRWFSISGEPLFDAENNFTGYRGIGKDITDRKNAEEQIQHMAMHDALTGLPNRELMKDRLAHEIAFAQRHGNSIWILFVDLDRFKIINDSLGHKAGDALLQLIAQRLQAVLRQNDTCARIGGDEFVLVLPSIPGKNISTNVVQRILDAVKEPTMLENQQIVISCSIGIAVYPLDGTVVDDLVEHADIAMYRAKESGKNNFQFYTSLMNDRVSERLAMEVGLRRALEYGEFVLHYQPQVDLASNRIVGMEALLRWQDPVAGLIAPNRFIPIAEDTGLIIPIGLWVLKTACAQNKAWQAAGFDSLKVAVNLSSRQFSSPGLAQEILNILEETALAPHCLGIEITEGLLMKNTESAVGVLSQLRHLGIHVSIDDFGTGFSSLAYLKRFPINVLKIDQSFIQDISIDKTSEAIVASVISLAHNLGILVVAEGVETVEQLDFLRQHGCDQMQGYYFSRPVPPLAFETILKQGKQL